jgi:predicted ATPase
MQFLNHLLYQVFIAKPAMGPIISFRMVEMTIQFGMCNIAPFAFGVYGAFLVSTINSDLEGGYRMGRIALESMKRLNAFEIIPRLYSTIYSMASETVFSTICHNPINIFTDKVSFVDNFIID